MVEESWGDLPALFPGRAVLRGDDAYASARERLLWSSRTPERYPTAILRVQNAAEVQQAVRYARARHARVAIRGGGHHFSAFAVRHGGLALDLSALRTVTMDSAARTATVEPGVTAGALDAALAPRGLGFPVGHCRGVPMSGYLLNGGIGWNTGAWGPACASVRGVEVVGASGDVIHASADEHADLYWAARGGGIGFPGVVTRFHLALHPRPRIIRTRTLRFAAGELPAVAAWLDGLRGELPPEIELIALVVSPPADARAAGAPDRLVVVSATAFAGSEGEAARLLAPFVEPPAGMSALGSTLDDTPMETLFDGMDAAFPTGYRYASDQCWSDGATAQLLASVARVALDPPSPRDFLLFAFAPGPSQRASPPPDMALSVPGATYVGAYAVWEHAGDDMANDRWLAAVGDALMPYTAGRYVGEANLAGGLARVRACYPAATWERLAAVRRKDRSRATSVRIRHRVGRRGLTAGRGPHSAEPVCGGPGALGAVRPAMGLSGSAHGAGRR